MIIPYCACFANLFWTVRGNLVPLAFMSEAPSSDKYPNYRSYAFVAALVVFVTALVLYCVTLAPTVTLVDSGELMLAAWGPGVAHPPGFPLYLMLAHIASLLPAGSVALRLNGFSALFGALAAAMLTLATYEAMAAIRSERKAAPEKFEIVAAVAAGLLFVFSRTIWAYSTVTEVYSLNTFLIATVLWLMLAWRRTTGDGDGYRLLYIAAFVFGLGLCVHHVTVAFLLPGLAVLVYTQTGGKFFLSKRLLFATLAAFAGLTLYLYLPIAASRSPLMNWGDVNSAERLWWHISGRQYQVFFDFSISRLGEFASLVNREFGRPWLLMGVAAALFGLVYLWQRARPYFWLYTLICASCLLYCMSYSIADDKDAYYLPAFACL